MREDLPEEVLFARAGFGVTEVGMRSPSYPDMMAEAADRADVRALAFAGVIAMAPSRPAPYDVPIAGLKCDDLAALLHTFFPGCNQDSFHVSMDDSACTPRSDEFFDLVELLMSHCSGEPRIGKWVAHAIATASMGQNHLWQDMGLPHRGALNELIRSNFAGLHALNSGDMKWKKFFYRQLCERAEIPICKSPSCGACIDHRVCFGPEDGAVAPMLACAPAADVSIAGSRR